MNSTIIIIDDDDIIRHCHDLILKKSGFTATITCFSNGLNALEYLDNHHMEMQHCIIFLDINMPVINGWQMLSEFEQSPYRNKLDVVLVSSSIDSSDHEKAKSYSLVRKFVVKPLNIDTCNRIKSEFSFLKLNE